MTPTIDAHQHFWQLSRPFNYTWLDAPELAPIRRDYLPEHLEPHFHAVEVDNSIFVQTQHDAAENRWVLGLADEHEFLAGVVGWVDLASDDCYGQLVEFMDHPKAVGVRHVVQDEPDDDFIVREDVLRGLKILERHAVPFDLLFYVKHLRHVPTLARLLPELPMVIDHLAKPRIREHRTDDWLPHFRAAAEFPNVFCKLSGLVTEADWRRWTIADLSPFVNEALERFGPHRLMFGSDWPVCELAGTYEQVYHALVEALGPLGDAERAAIFGGTAARFYGLSL
jgi:L-fuconolactonase